MSAMTMPTKGDIIEAIEDGIWAEGNNDNLAEVVATRFVRQSGIFDHPEGDRFRTAATTGIAHGIEHELLLGHRVGYIASRQAAERVLRELAYWRDYFG